MNYCPKCGVKLQERTVDGKRRLVCTADACEFIHWDNPIPVIAALVRWRGQFVIARNAAWPSGAFSIVTGFLERNETPEQALCREMKEELGLDLDAWGFIGHYSFSEANQLILAFLAEGSGELLPGSDVAEAKVLTRDEIESSNFARLLNTAPHSHVGIVKQGGESDVGGESIEPWVTAQFDRLATSRL